MELKELLGEAYKEGMTFEEVEEVLKGIELPKTVEPDLEAEKRIAELKRAISKSNSEAAEYKRQLRAKQTEEEAKAAAEQEERERLVKENEELKRGKAISENISSLVGIGFNSELASSTAEAMFNGDVATVISNMKTMLDAKDSEIRTEIMQQTPKPVTGSGTTPITKKAIMEIKDDTERQQAIQNNLELFK